MAAPACAALHTVAIETERFVAAGGWDQPPRLFALVRTVDLLAREPHLRGALAGDAADGEAVSAVEQDGIPPTSDVESLLARIEWPPEVAGCAFAVERIVVPPEVERDLPAEPRAALDALLGHPDRRDVRLLVAVLRGGAAVCVLRQRQHDRDDLVSDGPDLAPGLVSALHATFAD